MAGKNGLIARVYKKSSREPKLIWGPVLRGLPDINQEGKSCFLEAKLAFLPAIDTSGKNLSCPRSSEAQKFESLARLASLELTEVHGMSARLKLPSIRLNARASQAGEALKLPKGGGSRTEAFLPLVMNKPSSISGLCCGLCGLR